MQTSPLVKLPEVDSAYVIVHSLVPIPFHVGRVLRILRDLTARTRMGQIAGYGNLRIAQQFPMMSLDEEGSDFPIRQHVRNSIESQPAQKLYQP